MSRWVNAKRASQILQKNKNQIAVDHHNDKRVGWNRRIQKINNRLYVNIDDYRSKTCSNTLTRKRLEKLYFELEESIGKAEIIKNVSQMLSISYQAVGMYFSYFSFRDRVSSLRYYLALKHLKRVHTCTTPMTLSTNAA